MSRRNITASLMSWFALFALNATESQAVDGAPILDNSIDHVEAEPIELHHMSQERFDSILHPDLSAEFKSEKWKAYPDDRTRMLNALIPLLAGISQNNLRTLLGPEQILGGRWVEAATADGFLLRNARCGFTPMPVLEVDYKSKKAFRYRFLYFPEGVSANIMEASDWFAVAK